MDWKIYLDGEHIETVVHDRKVKEEQILAWLVEDGYPPDITIKKQPPKKDMYQRRYRFNRVGDPFVLGIITGLLGVEERVRGWIEMNEDTNRLFEMGMKEAHEHTLKDVRYELHHIWRTNPELFREDVGEELFSQVVLVCQGLTDEEIRKKEREMERESQRCSDLIEETINKMKEGK